MYGNTMVFMLKEDLSFSFACSNFNLQSKISYGCAMAQVEQPVSHRGGPG
jgi:hypothetical protein